MNILYLCDEYPPGRHGGIGTVVQLLARTAVILGHKVTVAGFYDLGYGGEDNFIDEGVQVYRFRRSMDADFFAAKDSLKVRIAGRVLHKAGIFQKDIEGSLKRYHVFLEEIIKKHNVDIVEMPDFNEYVQFCTRYTPFPKLSVPTVVKLHGSVTYFLKEEGKPVPTIIYEMEQNLLRQADAVISVSDYTARHTAKYLNYSKKIAVLYNGIDTRQIHTADNKDTQRVIFSGTLVAKKGIYQLLKAWNIVNEKMPNTYLWICGKGDTTKAMALLDQGVAGSVVFKGHVQRQVLMQYLSTSTIAVFPSFAEAFSLAVMEAMAAGTAVINSARTSGPEIVEDKKTGLLIDPDKPEEIADRILYLLQNPDICGNLAKAGAQHVKNNFDIKIITEKQIAFYEKVLNTKNSEPI